MNKKKKTKTGKQVNQRSTGLARIDLLLLKETKIQASKRSTTIRALIEEGLAEVLAVKNDYG